VLKKQINISAKRNNKNLAPLYLYFLKKTVIKQDSINPDKKMNGIHIVKRLYTEINKLLILKGNEKGRGILGITKISVINSRNKNG